MHKYVTGDIIRDKVRGTLVGGAIGDAWGGPHNHKTTDDILNENSLGITRFHDYPRTIKGKENKYWRPAGSYTDDTQQTLLLAEHLADNKGFDPHKFSTSLAELVNGDHYRGGGRNTRAWAERIKKGESYKTASSAEAETTGSIMRDSPIALFYWPDKDILREKTIECSSVSHKRWDVVAPCLTFSKLIQLSLSGYPTETQMDHFKDTIELHDEEVLVPMSKIIHNITKIPGITDRQRDIAADVKTRVVAAQARNAFSQFSSDFVTAINSAAVRSRDRDTCAKLTGELVGARHGIGIIPEELIEIVEDGKKILAIADRLYEAHLSVFPPETRTLQIQVPAIEKKIEAKQFK